MDERTREIKTERVATPHGVLKFDPIECAACGKVVSTSEWQEHARTHNPSAYREGWPCTCRPGDPCDKHLNADWEI